LEAAEKKPLLTVSAQEVRDSVICNPEAVAQALYQTRVTIRHGVAANRLLLGHTAPKYTATV
jgi:hypothetical protein